MRITAIQEVTVPLAGNIANALVNFSQHTVSLVAVRTDVVRNGRPVVGYAFDSIGRFAQGGILRDRVIPRVLAADPPSLLNEAGDAFDPAKVAAAAMRNEKPGGHGDRACAVAAVELAIWDLNAKLADEPAHATIARHFGRQGARTDVDVYAAGGYYYPPGSGHTLTQELLAYRELGFDAYKIKIGGASLEADIARIEEALNIAGDGRRLSVDANGRFDLPTALRYAQAIAPYGLRWYEEAGDPLDYGLNRELAQAYGGALATGENLFSLREVVNLLDYGGPRPGQDIFQMDAGLCYGLTEYAAIVDLLESRGYSRRQAYPHGGHLINLHIAVGLELGGCEAYPGVFQPFGGYPPGCGLAQGRVRPTSAPGFGLEEKAELAPWIAKLTG
ncbi:mandelate racemase [Bordetella sp. H567]|uniref:enolase C-terminal domain-like protein n=1 Tax=Bordetella sp. H567 TaxID=1697043 RepID=UPI00081C4FA0|nr:enolase C-terminal domain-like protein [Bordetella sp. H567]AOB30360.1 mandelate racemase [Bordetella sp. H567]